MRVLRAIVIANRKKKIALRIKKEVEAFLRSRGVKISANSALSGQNGISPSPTSPQLVITVGGDGTVFLSKEHYGIPFFSIGSGTSFICQATFSDWRRKLPRALSSIRAEPRLMLSSALNGKALPPSLNEIGIRNPEPRVLALHLAVKSKAKRIGAAGKKSRGERHFAFRADGIIFSTPTGSMAYCYSCGGREMKSTGKKYQAVAISPFRRLFRPIVLPEASQCTLRLSGHERAQLFIDGQIVASFSEKDTLRVRSSSRKFYFAKV